MRKQKASIEYGIIGLGTFGMSLAKELSEAGKEVIVLDHDENKIKLIKNYVDEVFLVKELDRETLEETGIQNCDTVIVCISKDVAVSVLTTLTVINMDVPRVIAKATSDEQGIILEKLGAEVIYPEKDMAVRLANKLLKSKSLDYITLNGNVTVAEFKIPDELAGKTIYDCNIREHFSLNIIAVENNENTVTEIDPEYVLKNSDLIVLVGSNKNIHRLEKKYYSDEK